MVATPDSGCVVFSHRYENGINTGFNHDLYYAKLNSSGEIVEPVPVSTNELPFTKNEVRLYPNPVQRYLNIKNPANQQLRLQLFDLKGQTVLSKKINNEISIDIQHLPSGIYTFVIQSIKVNTFKSGKLVKL